MSEGFSPESIPVLDSKSMLRYDGVRKCDQLLLPERVVELNTTGASILKLCNGTRTVAQIIEELEDLYGQPGLAADIIAFLDDTACQGWIKDLKR